MINPHRVAELLSNLVSERLSINDHCTTNSVRDEEVAKHLYDNVESIINSTHYSFETEDTIDFNDNSSGERYGKYEEEEEGEYEQRQQQINNNDEQFDEIFMDVDEDQQQNLFHQFSIQYMKKAVDFYDVVNEKTGRFSTYLENNGTKQQKLDEIDQYIYEKFEKAREDFLIVHDTDLKRWALQKATEIDDTTFRARDNWVLIFKRRYALCSRKITKLITKTEGLDADAISYSANNFISKIKKLLPHYRQSNVLNTDQSGLEIELVGNRTSSFKGEKATFGKVRSVYNTSHSYTVQFIISLSGEPTGTCYLCLKEKDGHMSDNIKKNLFQTFNVTVTCSKSGKLSSSLVKYWIQKVLKPAIGNEKVLLLLYTWGAPASEQL
ncbi:unnamed protein product [Rotaria magnacalcarata]|uniref:HTH CENPB-type domain-containing protein n=1 Tax=Rotaria magnacalcarata TaxID=392030 RepID=A0A816QHI5_9BILA|nr:unnamed protein product [Rotaria magnacalcarata]CAF4093849.1 unnamed protein product [Rotaria magnacalcarata]CAF4386156.1 unnamed protein product [Rotaria magnacalcarata]